MEPLLAFDGVWKRFRRGASHDSLRDLIPALARRLTGRDKNRVDSRDFWALSDLSFEVKPGEVLGIIGTNGAGKSTALKILNKLMQPTQGLVHTRGKIGSLIEVSAGFHQDLTGRQNVFLQGAIMGMRKAEIVRKFDQIVDFSGISDFIDTPVKRYSSGMNARLGFSIAAHLEPDILIIDEVLAVGDYAFQQRAFGKIKSLATAGAPVVLVSHQLDRIQELCTKAILLEKGKVKMSGTAAQCIGAYLHPPTSEQKANLSHEVGVHFDSMVSTNGVTAFTGEDVAIEVKGRATRSAYPVGWQLALRVIDSNSGDAHYSVLGSQRDVAMPAEGEFEHRLVLQMNLAPGNYYLELVVWDTDKVEDVLRGPRVNVEVLANELYWGQSQLNARWSVVSSTNGGKASVPLFSLSGDRQQ